VIFQISRKIRHFADSIFSGWGKRLPFPKKWYEHTQIDISDFQRLVITKHAVGWRWCAGCNNYVSAKRFENIKSETLVKRVTKYYFELYKNS